MPDDDAPAGGETASKEEPPAPEHGRHEQPARRGRTDTRLAGVLIGVLVALLGFAIAVQVRSSSGDTLDNARQDDLIRILDDQNSRADRLRQQLTALEATERQLSASGDRDSVAYTQAREQLDALRVLLGVVPATGPGVTVTISDPGDGLGPEDLLDVVQELRGAGAEAIQIDDVRVGTDSAFTGSSETPPQLDGVTLTAPYRVLAIGDPPTLDRALNIFGGVAATVRSKGGDITIVQQETVQITATRPLPATPDATPSR